MPILQLTTDTHIPTGMAPLTRPLSRMSKVCCSDVNVPIPQPPLVQDLILIHRDPAIETTIHLCTEIGRQLVILPPLPRQVKIVPGSPTDREDITAILLQVLINLPLHHHNMVPHQIQNSFRPISHNNLTTLRLTTVPVTT